MYYSTGTGYPIDSSPFSNTYGLVPTPVLQRWNSLVRYREYMAVGYTHDLVTSKRLINIVVEGGSEVAYSWFPGYSWTICKCKICSNQVVILSTFISYDSPPLSPSFSHTATLFAPGSALSGYIPILPVLCFASNQLGCLLTRQKHVNGLCLDEHKHKSRIFRYTNDPNWTAILL